MKTITKIAFILSLAFLTSCQGEQGPPGVDGLNGLDGTSLLGSVFEITGTFDQSNDYSLHFNFPSDFEIYTSDIVMVYILWGQTNDAEPLDIWQPLPHNTLLGSGEILQYNFDYTVADVYIYLDATVDRSTLSEGDTNNQTFRIAVMPAAFATDKSVNLNSLGSVMKAMKITSNGIQTLDVSKPM